MAFLDQSEDSVNIAIKTMSDDTGIKETNKNLNSITKTAEDTSKKSDDVASNWKSNMNKVAVATAAVGAGLTLYAKNATDYAVNYVKNARSIARITGDSTEETSRLLAVTNRLGLDTGKVGSIFGIFSKKIAEASGDTNTNRIAQEKLQIQIRATQKAIDDNANEIKKNGDKTGDLTLKQDALKNKLAELQDQAKKTTNPLEGLNVSLKNADGTSRSFSAILLDVSDKFKAMPNGAQKTALAMDLFGRSGKDMIKVLNLGSAGIRDLEAQADKLGLTLTSKNIGQIDAYIKAQKEMKLQTDSLKMSVGLATVPVLTDFQSKLNQVTATLLGMHGPVHTATVDVLAFGGPVLGATAAVVGFAANVSTMIDGLAKLGFVLANFVWWATFASLAAAAIGGTIVWMHKLGGEWSSISNSIIGQSDCRFKEYGYRQTEIRLRENIGRTIRQRFTDS
jgi:hypothetical protein